MTTDTSNFNFQGIGIVGAIDIYGCTFDGALNYDPTATIDDGSCVGIVDGCIDPAACNFDVSLDPPVNRDDGSCEYCSCAYPSDFGCTDPDACNYDPTADCDDGSCSGLAGCMDPTACNYDSLATCDDGSCDGLLGCTDATASNYNSNATCDDGSCIPCVYGCTDPADFNYDRFATCDDGTCIDVVYGCMDSDANNYDSSANVDDPNNPCTYDVLGCTDINAFNYDLNATIDDGSCKYIGCMDDGNMPSTYTNNQGGSGSLTPGTAACNYDPWANVDDGSCIYISPAGCSDCSGSCESGFVLGPATIGGVANPYCTKHPGCMSHIERCSMAGFDGPCCCQPIQAGCMDPLADNFDCATALNPGSTSPCHDHVNVDDGTCTYPPVLGCIDPTANNYDALATNDDGSCTYDVLGCTDMIACNYDATATVDDGSCCYGICGCTDPTAANYDATAGCDDGSCTYAPLACVGYTAIPDEEFRKKLNANYSIVNWYDASGNPVSDYIQGEYCASADICNITTLDVSGRWYSLGLIADLTGIQNFVALTTLKCAYNKLTNIDVSQNTNLDYLDVTHNQLTTLDVSNNTALYSLYVFQNDLTSLNVSNNTALEVLKVGSRHIDENQITSLDLTQNTALTYLVCAGIGLTSIDLIDPVSGSVYHPALKELGLPYNQLTGGLDVSQHTNLKHLSVYRNDLTKLDIRNGNNLSRLNTGDNFNLTCVSVNDVSWATNQETVPIGVGSPTMMFEKETTTVWCAGPCTGGTC